MAVSRFSFGPERRLRFHWEFKRFFSDSQVMRLSECVVFVVPNEKAHFRLGITMKARGTSIERNNVKRRIREGFRTRAPLLGAFDYNVVVPGSKKMAHPYELRLAKCLDRELESALSRLRT